jgi:hypothetical protein
VERDRYNIEIAIRYFGLKPSKHLAIHHSDARHWIIFPDSSPARYGLIVDDCCAITTATVERSIHAGTAWVRHLRRRLTDDGILVLNMPSSEAFRDLWQSLMPIKERDWSAALRVRIEGADNCILVLVRGEWPRSGSLKDHTVIPGRTAKARLKVRLLWHRLDDGSAIR